MSEVLDVVVVENAVKAAISRPEEMPGSKCFRSSFDDLLILLLSLFRA